MIYDIIIKAIIIKLIIIYIFLFKYFHSGKSCPKRLF